LTDIFFYSLVDKDLKQSLPVKIYSGDKAYDDSNNHFHLARRGLYSAILLMKNRINKNEKQRGVAEFDPNT